MVYFLQQDAIIIKQNIDSVIIFENIIPPRPVEPRKNLTITTLEKLINSELLLNLIPDNTAQKIHIPINNIIKPTKFLCLLIGYIKELENWLESFIKYIY